MNAASVAPSARGGVQTSFATNISAPAAPSTGPSGAASGGRRGNVSIADGVAGASSADPGAFTSPNSSSARSNGQPSLRLGVAGGSNAAGKSGIIGSARGATGTLEGSTGMMAGPQLQNSSGPSLGIFGGKGGQRDSILTQADTAGGSASSSDFTVAKGSGLRPEIGRAHV